LAPYNVIRREAAPPPVNFGEFTYYAQDRDGRQTLFEEQPDIDRAAGRWLAPGLTVAQTFHDPVSGPYLVEAPSGEFSWTNDAIEITDWGTALWRVDKDDTGKVVNVERIPPDLAFPKVAREPILSEQVTSDPIGSDDDQAGIGRLEDARNTIVPVFMHDLIRDMPYWRASVILVALSSDDDATVRSLLQDLIDA
jgi:hypothetical protein